jgi:hypothetical protein
MKVHVISKQKLMIKRPIKIFDLNMYLFQSVAELRHFCAAPGTNFDVAPASTPASNLQYFKGIVQQKLTGVLSGINRKLLTCHCSNGYSFF